MPPTTRIPPTAKDNSPALCRALRLCRQARGQIPDKGAAKEIDQTLWEVPGTGGMRYLYVSGLAHDGCRQRFSPTSRNIPAARFVLTADGSIRSMKSEDIRRRIAGGGKTMKRRFPREIGLWQSGVLLSCRRASALSCRWNRFLCVLRLDRFSGKRFLQTARRTRGDRRRSGFVGGADRVVPLLQPRHLSPDSIPEQRDSRPWKFRWSLSIVFLVISLFTAGICILVMIHEVGWLVTSNEADHQIRRWKRSRPPRKFDEQSQANRLGHATITTTNIKNSRPAARSTNTAR